MSVWPKARLSSIPESTCRGHVAQRNLLAVQEELVAERLDRRKAEEACEQAIIACHAAEENLQATMATQRAQAAPPQVEGKGQSKTVGS